MKRIAETNSPGPGVSVPPLESGGGTQVDDVTKGFCR